MKKLRWLGIALLVSIVAVPYIVKAEQAKTGAAVTAPATKPAKKKAKKMKAMYKCEHCNMTSEKPGKCSMCGTEMKKI